MTWKHYLLLVPMLLVFNPATDVVSRLMSTTERGIWNLSFANFPFFFLFLFLFLFLTGFLIGLRFGKQAILITTFIYSLPMLVSYSILQLQGLDYGHPAQPGEEFLLVFWYLVLLGIFANQAYAGSYIKIHGLTPKSVSAFVAIAAVNLIALFPPILLFPLFGSPYFAVFATFVWQAAQLLIIIMLPIILLNASNLISKHFKKRWRTA